MEGQTTQAGRVGRWLIVPAALLVALAFITLPARVPAGPAPAETSLRNAASPAAPTTARPRTPAAADPSGPAAPGPMQAIVGGVPRRFTSGDELPVVADVLAALYVRAVPNRRNVREIELHLYHDTPDTPVSDARILGTAEMIYMSHGIIRPPVQPAGAGRYLMLVEFPMAGEWKLDLEIASADKSGLLQLTLDVFE